MTHLHGQKFWLYGAVDPHTNETQNWLEAFVVYQIHNKVTAATSS